jgi:hypothetical protein
MRVLKTLALVQIGELHGILIGEIREIAGKLLEHLAHSSRSQALQDYLN